jgi:hypothetical protein
MNKERKEIAKKNQKKLILMALNDEKFKKLLISNPEKALKRKMTSDDKKDIKLIITIVKSIETQITSIADAFLCNDTITWLC